MDIAVAGSRAAQQGQQTKMEQIYQYLTGSRFWQRIFAVDAWRAPKRIFDAHLPDQGAQSRIDL
jgi:hypothetical protein